MSQPSRANTLRCSQEYKKLDRKPIAGSSELTRHHEAVLVAELKAGHPRAYQSLFRRHRAYIEGLCSAMLGCRTEAEDVSQQVFMRVYLHIQRFEERSQLRTWMHRIALNLCKNRLSQRSRRPLHMALPLDALSVQTCLHDPVKSLDCPESAYRIIELGFRMQSACEKIAPEHVDLILRWAVKGQSYHQIAASLSVSIGTVKSRLHRARRALSKALNIGTASS